MVDMFKVTPFDHPVGSPTVMVGLSAVKMIEDASFVEDKKGGDHKESTMPVEKPSAGHPIVRTKITFHDGKVLMVHEPMGNFEHLMR